MPFTLAHPAAILPLRGVRVLGTVPLILGAIAPDLPYFLPGSLGRLIPQTHEFEASYSICLVLGYALLIAVYVLRRPLTALLAPRARWLCLHALAPFRRGWRAWLLAPLGIVVGVWSHLLWDSFTHADGWIVHRVAALSAPVTIGSYNGPLCHVLQYVSSAVGLVVMVLWYARLRAPAVPSADPHATRSPALPILALVGTAALLIGGVQAIDTFHRTELVYRSIYILLTHGLTCFALLYLVAGVIVTLDHPEPRELRS